MGARIRDAVSRKVNTVLIHAARPRRVALWCQTPRSRRTSSHRKGDANEQAILETAERLLGASAFSEISISDLAASAGISRSSFYFYFGSKDEVLMTLFGTASPRAQADRPSHGGGHRRGIGALTSGIEGAARL